MIILLFFLLCIANACHATEYIYPIGIVPHCAEKKVVIMHQNAHNRLQVFLWDSVTHTYELGLSSQYNPIALCRLINNLPDRKGVHSWLFV